MRAHRSRTEDGAAVVEMAMVLPLLLLLVLGMIEFGFLFARFNEVRHGVREGARYAAVSNPDLDGSGTAGDIGDVVKATCEAINLPGATITVSMTATGSQRLDNGTITVEADVSPLSGAPIVSGFLPSQLSNSATFRLEQDANWSPFVDQTCP